MASLDTMSASTDSMVSLRPMTFLTTVTTPSSWMRMSTDVPTTPRSRPSAKSAVNLMLGAIIGVTVGLTVGVMVAATINAIRFSPLAAPLGVAPQVLPHHDSTVTVRPAAVVATKPANVAQHQAVRRERSSW